ncbi:hypothetical protein acsn021_38780 [Anaerocolumna cellulosilytica]|uniref:Integrase Tn916-type N-terminal DNA binding domain-containing protein n=1 Tax=Anaerocolumna cellulosilytica TaxID=433286 RepID=A0A6S6R4N9_9FIRM|nr:hypothetical protein [Anaerocolumna cellulosilytica]BCJ96309.1 hypothetical protein acsn021_38780 [Anaerocolumna cellulosilytica]
MAARKDNKGRALRKGEIYREIDNRYAYGYTDPYGNRRFIYSKDLKKLREREENLLRISWMDLMFMLQVMRI